MEHGGFPSVLRREMELSEFLFSIGFKSLEGEKESHLLPDEATWVWSMAFGQRGDGLVSSRNSFGGHLNHKKKRGLEGRRKSTKASSDDEGIHDGEADDKGTGDGGRLPQNRYKKFDCCELAGKWSNVGRMGG